VAVHGRVALDGTGGDEALVPSGSHVLYRLKNWRLDRLVLDMGRTVFLHRRRPRVGLMAAWRHQFQQEQPLMPYPDWLNPDLARRLDLPERWNTFAFRRLPMARPRERGRRTLASAVQTRVLQLRDPGLTHCPVEVRFPFFDLRLLNYLLALPVLPWCLDKEVLRVALRGKVPETVRRRPKTPLCRDPLQELLRRGGLDSMRPPQPAPKLARYVQPSALLPAEDAARSGKDAWMALRPHKLNAWLQSLIPTQPLTPVCKVGDS
jgi:asparagine synthase (glutamine-hydrolysing)